MLETQGYVGLDTASLFSEAAMQQICEQLEPINLDKDTTRRYLIPLES